MRKIILTAAMAALVSTTMAAEPIQWGVIAGMNVSNYSEGDMDSRIGFTVGFTGKTNCENSGLYLQSGLQLSLKGAKETIKESGINVETTISPYYIEIPIQVGYSYPLMSGFDLFASVGPTLSYGLFGKAKAEAKYEGVKVSEKVDVFGDGDDDMDFRRFDLGLGFKVGCEINKKIQISLGYDWGLIDVVEDSDVKNRNFQVSAAYLF